MITISYTFLLVLLLAPFVAPQSQCNALFHPETCITDRLVMERHSFVDNLRKEVSCYVRGHSSESIIIHVLLVFSDPVHHFHNALLLNPASVEKYQKILRESEFPFNNELMIVSKGQEMVVQYDIANQSWQLRYFDGSSAPQVPLYDAIMSLDYYASLWSEYNGIVLERSKISLKMIEPPFDQDRPVDNADYSGFYKMWCNKTVSVKRCHVALSGVGTATNGPAISTSISDLLVNGRSYNVTGIIIDTGRSDNLLPYDLYVRWRYHGERNLRLTLPTVGATTTTTTTATPFLLLHLNHQFEYDINHESGDIVLGLDLLLYFQKAEYCMEGGYYKVWYYNHLYSWHEQHLVNVAIVMLFVSTLLSIFFYWVISTNYSVQDYILDGQRTMEFPYVVVLSEMVAYAIGVTMVVLAIVFIDDISSLAIDATGHKQRTILFVTVLLWHWLVGVWYLAWLRRAQTKQAARYYGSQAWHYMVSSSPPKGTAAKRDVVATYSFTATPGYKAKVRDVIIRNTMLNNTVSMSLLLIFNYIVEDRPLFLAILLVISAVVTYYWLKMILVSFQYMVVSQRQHHALWYYERRFMILTLFSIAFFVAYVILAFPLVYLSCFREFNSMYSDIFLWIFGLHLHALIVLFASGIVFIITVRHYIQKNQQQQEQEPVGQKQSSHVVETTSSSTTKIKTE